MMDARRNQVYAGVYRVGDMLLECVTGQKAVSIEDYIAELNDLGILLPFWEMAFRCTTRHYNRDLT